MNDTEVYTGQKCGERAPGNNAVYFQASSCLMTYLHRPQTECQELSILPEIQQYPFSSQMPPKSQSAPEEMSFDCVRLIF